MASGFFSLEIGRRSLLAHRQAMDVTSHNIANANTPGYSRQRVDLASIALAPVPGSLTSGVGVEVADITRLRNAFLDSQYRRASAEQHRWEARRESLSQIETLLNEPSDDGIQAAFDEFWASFQDLSNAPENDAARSVVVEQGHNLAASINQVYDQLTDLRRSIDDEIAVSATRINTLTQRIAHLNERIVEANVAGSNVNDLMDERTRALQELSDLIGPDVQKHEDGSITLSLNGITFVDGTYVNEVSVDRSGAGNRAQLQWENGDPLDIKDGRLAGLLQVRDQELPGIVADLNDMTSAFGEAVNAIHRDAYTPGSSTPSGQDLFEWQTGRAAETIAWNDAVQAEDIATASEPDSPGDGSAALAIAELKDEPLAALGDSTIGEHYRSLVGRLGVASAEAARMAKTQEDLTTQIENQQQSVSGVSLDEEMTHMIQYQKAFEAAARVVTTTDEMLDTIINRMAV